MDEEKKNTKFWQSLMTIVVLFSVVVMVAWFNSQSPAVRPDENVSIGNGTHVPIGNGANAQVLSDSGIQTESSTGIQTESGTGIQTGNDTLVPMDNDTFFKTWVVLSFKEINENLDCISKASELRNLMGVEACGKLLANNSNLSLRHMIEYTNVSTSLSAASDEYKKALEDYKFGGENIAIGAKNENGSQMSDAIGYIQSGTTHVKLVAMMINGNNTTDGNLVHPKIGTNTT
jgi:hypothetical protein